MELTGRLTADSAAKKIGEERQVVNFSIAINDSYRQKNGETKEVVTYVDCAYWLNAGLAEWLKKGALVQLSGRLGINAYIDREGNAVGRISFHANTVKILAFAPKVGQQEKAAAQPTATEFSLIPDKDLPF